MARACVVYQFPEPVPYAQGWQMQKELVHARKADPQLPDALMVLEHPPVYTLGQGSDRQFLKFDLDHPPAPVYFTERGGQVTYHSIGQLVVYPIFNLNFYEKDLHWYLRQLETVIISTLADYGLVGQRKPGLTGVWMIDRKIAQIGIKVSRWITMHGVSLNVNMDMTGFTKIVPCGIHDYGCTQLADFTSSVAVSEVTPVVLRYFQQVFNLELTISFS